MIVWQKRGKEEEILLLARKQALVVIFLVNQNGILLYTYP